MIDNSEYIMLGSSFIEPESDEEEQLNIDYVGNMAIFQSRAIDIISTIGTTSFKKIYINLINDIKKYPFIEQELFFRMVLDQISKIYDFEFPENVDIYNWETINELYSFLEFLEYDNINFITLVWKFLDENLKEINLIEYCSKNKTKITLEIEEQVSSSSLNKFSLEFLKTYYKIVDWFHSNSERSKIEIMSNF